MPATNTRICNMTVHITSIYEIKLNWEKVGRDFEKCSELKLCYRGEANCCIRNVVPGVDSSNKYFQLHYHDMGGGAWVIEKE